MLIIGAGPTGLFCAHQLGIIGLSCEIVDNLDKAGGQCIELYPDKPIYDIPAIPECTGEGLTKSLIKGGAEGTEHRGRGGDPRTTLQYYSIIVLQYYSITVL